MRTRLLLLSFFFLAGIFLPQSSSARVLVGLRYRVLNELPAFPKDTIVIDQSKEKSPKKAAIMSACLPGLGQVYNGRKAYWKVPVIYAGFGGLIYGFSWNQSLFKTYRTALRLRYDNDPTTIDDYPAYSDNDLVTLKNYYQRYRDLCVIGMAALYTLQILDAVVDAHLSSFDVSDDLSLQVSPAIAPSAFGVTTMVGLRLSFR